VLLVKPRTKPISVPVAETKVYDRGADVIALNKASRICQRPCDSDCRAGALETVDNVEGDENFILNDEDGMAR